MQSRERKISERLNWLGMLDQVTAGLELAGFEKLLKIKERMSHGRTSDLE